MCYGSPAKSLEIARSRLTPEQWARFEREFDDFCVVQGLRLRNRGNGGERASTIEWAKWAFFQGRQERSGLYTMDQMREYADNFHLSRLRILVAEKEAYERHVPAIYRARDAHYERLAIAMMSDEQAQMSLERWASYEGMRRGK